MSRVQRVVPWVYTSAAVALVAWVSVSGGISTWAWRVSILAIAASAVGIVWRVNHMPVLFLAALTAGSVHLASIDVSMDLTGSDIRWGDSVPGLAVGLAFAILLGFTLNLRHGAMSRRDVLDAASVGLGAAVTAWIVIGNPLMTDFDVAPVLAIITAAYLPTAVILVAFTVDLLLTGLEQNRSMRFIVGAAVANLIGAALTGLRQVEVADGSFRSISCALFAAALFMLCAGLAHRDSPGTISRGRRVGFQRRHRPFRHLMIAASILTPIALTAATAPSSGADTVVRLVGTIALVGVIATRMWLAVLDDDLARTALLLQINRDELTKLPTRSRFIEYVTDILETTWRSEHRTTIIQVNLDRFKNLNDSLGHSDANRVLTEVAERLALVAAEHGAFAARSGGDGFVIVDASTTSTRDATARTSRVRSVLSDPIVIGSETIFLTASIGVAIAPANRTLSAEELMRRADIATHRAKANGRNCVEVFDDSMQARLADRMAVEHALHGAIERREMRLYHQPIVDVVTGEVNGFESLIRWRRADGSLLMPSSFVPIAEETGVIIEIGAWALEHALTELRGWIDDGVVQSSTTVSVNVSPRQIADPTFPEIVRAALQRTGVSPNHLWIEITESMMLQEPDLARATLKKVREMGVRIALDDFGTGYSSLSLLRQFPIQRIKIDREFVHGLVESENDRSLVRTIGAMAQSMGLDVVAEGVETIHQLQTLRELGCAKAQGFIISHPVPAKAMRSTMSALSELAELPFFQSGDEPDDRSAPIEEFDGSAMQMAGVATRGPMSWPQP